MIGFSGVLAAPALLEGSMEAANGAARPHPKSFYPLALGLLSLLVLLPSPPALARWALPDDVGWASRAVRKIAVHADGTWQENVALDIEILNERGRLSQGTQHLFYNSAAAKFQVTSAFAQLGEGPQQPVPPALIEDKPEASRANGFDAINRVDIAFATAEIGARLHLEYVQKTHEVPVPGHFDRQFNFGGDSLNRERIIEIDSEKPLFLASHDPEHYLAVTHTHDATGDHVHVRLTRPLLSMVIDEPDSFRDLEDYVWLAVSTAQQPDDLVSGVVDGYEKVLSSPLPPLFARIAEAARQEPDAVGQINAVTAGLADAVRYMGDWRPVKGAYLPRALGEVAATQFGDCKDFSGVTAAILRQLGFETHSAWVHRGDQPRTLPPLSVLGFNHAILQAKRDGVTYWLDPTNTASFAQGLFPDVIDRASLVLTRQGPLLQRIVLPPPIASQSTWRVHYLFDADGNADVRAENVLTGAAAVPLTARSRFATPEALQAEFRRAVAGPRRVPQMAMEPLDLTSRVVRDLRHAGTMRIEAMAQHSTAGLALTVHPFGALDRLAGLDVPNRRASFFLGAPEVESREAHIDHVRLIGQAPARCEVKTPWFQASRSVEVTTDAIAVLDQFVTLLPIVPLDALTGPEFARAQKRLRACVGTLIVAFERL